MRTHHEPSPGVTGGNPDGADRFAAYRFELYAQPIVTCAGALAAAELLVRPAAPSAASTAAPVLDAARRFCATVALDRQTAATAARLGRSRPRWQWSANLSPAGVRAALRCRATPPAGVWWELSEQIRPVQVPSAWVLACRRAPGRLAADDVSDPDVAAAWLARGVDIIKFDRRVTEDPDLLGELLAVCVAATVVLEGATAAQLDAAASRSARPLLGQSFSLAPPVPLPALVGVSPVRRPGRH